MGSKRTMKIGFKEVSKDQLELVERIIHLKYKYNLRFYENWITTIVIWWLRHFPLQYNRLVFAEAMYNDMRKSAKERGIRK